MKQYLILRYCFVLLALLTSCRQDDTKPEKPTVFSLNSVKVNGVNDGFKYVNLGPNPVITLVFPAKIDSVSVPAGVQWRSAAGE